MIYANLPFVRKNLDKIPKWVKKEWCHGGAKGKGKPIANSGLWQKIHEYMTMFEVCWMWNPEGSTFQRVMEKATSLAILSTKR